MAEKRIDTLVLLCAQREVCVAAAHRVRPAARLRGEPKGPSHSHGLLRTMVRFRGLLTLTRRDHTRFARSTRLLDISPSIPLDS